MPIRLPDLPGLKRLCLALWAASLSAAVLAQQAPARPPQPDVMTKAELRQCLDRQEALERRRVILDRERSLSDTEAAALAEEARLLSAQMRTIDSNDSKKLATFNSQLAGHNESVKRYNASLEALSDETSALNADTADMMAACTTRLFSKDDREDIQRERQGAKPAAPP